MRVLHTYRCIMNPHGIMGKNLNQWLCQIWGQVLKKIKRGKWNGVVLVQCCCFSEQFHWKFCSFKIKLAENIINNQPWKIQIKILSFFFGVCAGCLGVVIHDISISKILATLVQWDGFTWLKYIAFLLRFSDSLSKCATWVLTGQWGAAVQK